MAKYGDRVKDLRPRDYGEGRVVGYFAEFPDGTGYWFIQWDNPGLDNEKLAAGEFEIIETEWCRCEHNLSSHFDGVLEYQACLHEFCRCAKWKQREV